MIDFDDIWQKYSKYSRIEFVCFSFRAGLLYRFKVGALFLRHSVVIIIEDKVCKMSDLLANREAIKEY